MRAQVLLKEDQRIFVASTDTNLGPNAVDIDCPEDFDFSLQHNYKVVDGALVYDPLPEPEPEPVPTPLEALAAENRLLKARVQVLDARSDFLEDCIAEMAMQVYQ